MIHLAAAAMVATAARHTSAGVNQQIGALTLGTGATRPPAVRRILTEYENDEAVSGSLPADYPLLVILCEQPVSAAGQVWTSIRDFTDVEVAALYATRKADLASGWQHGQLTCYALARALAANLFANTAAADAARAWGDVRLLRCQSMTIQPTMQQIQNGAITAQLKVLLRLRDLSPLGS